MPAAAPPAGHDIRRPVKPLAVGSTPRRDVLRLAIAILPVPMFTARSVLTLTRPLALALSGCLLGACVTSSAPRAHQFEAFKAETPFEYWSSREPAGACEIGKRALLSQGYQVDDTKPLSIRGEKYFQPQSDQATKLAINLACLPSNLGAVIYANALETHFELKSRGNNAGVSVSGLGSISLPWAGDKDVLVKVGEETVTAPDFYRRLFELIKLLDG